MPQEMSVELNEHVIASQWNNETTPYPLKISNDIQSQGYRIDDNKRPIFIFSYQNLTLEDLYQPNTTSDGLQRTLSINGESDLYTRAARADHIEKINDEFYQHYKDLYINLKSNLDKDKEFSSFAKKINLEIGHFAKKLLGQIVFCYFLQKKGWLGVDKDKSFGTGKSSFLRNKFEEYKKNKQNFFNYFLEFFFYKGLNNKNENDFVKEINCRVPFVGGGLFEYHEGYDWQKENLNIPHTTFSNLDKD
jgi:hypothetical protein